MVTLATPTIEDYSTFMPFIREMCGTMSCANTKNGLSARFEWPIDEEYKLPIRQFTFWIGRPAILYAGIVSIYHHPQYLGLPESLHNLKLPMLGRDEVKALGSFVGDDAISHIIDMKGSQEIMLQQPVTVSARQTRTMEKREARIRSKLQLDIPKTSGVAVLGQLLLDARQNDQ